MPPSPDARFPGFLERRLSRRSVLGRAAGTGTAAALAAGAWARPSATFAQDGTPVTQASPVANAAPTVVLVHGAFADGSSWAGVIKALQAAGVEARAVANPLRGPASDAAYLASFVTQFPGPVLLVGHSYGGAAISAAAPQAPNVVGLVYVAGFIPDEGESLQALAGQATDSLLGPALRPVPFSTGAGAEPGAELYIDPASFHEVFAADLPPEDAAVLAASQRPANAAGFGEPLGPVGWKTLPSWAVIATADKAIGVSGLRLMAERAGATTVDVDASHVVMISQPQAVADLIQSALVSLA
jgi:pimeloyl-ACP methyl ester carboxylesterase